MKHSLFVLLSLTFALAACAPAPTPAPTPTETLAATATTAPTASLTATFTQVIDPSMENLPAEWQGKIDHIETMTNMDGKTTRVVAVESLTDEDKAAGKTEAKLRVLQWDGKEWVSYVPQVGLIGRTKFWRGDSYGPDVISDNLTGSELQAMVADPIYGKDGQEIKPGLVADFEDVSVFCVDVIESKPYDDAQRIVMSLPMTDGDFELLMAIDNGNSFPSGALIAAYNQTEIDPSKLINPMKYSDKSIQEVIGGASGMTIDQFQAYLSLLTDGKAHRILVSIPKFEEKIGPEDSASARKQFANSYLENDVINSTNIAIGIENYLVISPEMLKTLSVK